MMQIRLRLRIRDNGRGIEPVFSMTEDVPATGA